MGGLGVSAAAAGSLLSSARALAGTPQKGGTERFAGNPHGPDDQMDPILFTSGIDYTRGRATYNGLIQIRDNMALAPELAEEWSPNADATEYTFKIRKGVEFHDGSPLTADDVVWSMNRHLGEDSPSTGKALFANVGEWTKVDAHTVKAMLTSPDSDLPFKLGEKQARIAKMDTEDFRKGNGTGPFLLESFEPGVRSTHVRNPNCWRDGANFDALEITAARLQSRAPATARTRQSGNLTIGTRSNAIAPRRSSSKVRLCIEPSRHPVSTGILQCGCGLTHHDGKPSGTGLPACPHSAFSPSRPGEAARISATG